MLIDHPISLLQEGSTKPLLALDENKHKVVLKIMLHPNNGKILLNEYLSGNLATYIRLPWPKVQIATLGSKVIEFLNERSINPQSMKCVAINYIRNLEKIPWPNLPTGQSDWGNNFDLLPTANLKHLSSYFNNPITESAFYGKALFDLWLFFQDTKYDTLFARNNSPFFLDGSHAFGGTEWEFNQMNYSITYFSLKSPYLIGILNELDLYYEWIERIESIPNSYINSLIKSVPSSWSISKIQSEFLIDLLNSKRKLFISFCKEEIEWRKSNKGQ